MAGGVRKTLHEKRGKQETMQVNNHYYPIPSSLYKYKMAVCYNQNVQNNNCGQTCRDGVRDGHQQIVSFLSQVYSRSRSSSMEDTERRHLLLDSAMCTCNGMMCGGSSAVASASVVSVRVTPTFCSWFAQGATESVHGVPRLHVNRERHS